MFYAIEHTYGVGVTSATKIGGHVGAVYCFDTAKARDLFVSEGPADKFKPGYRSKSNLAEARRCKRPEFWIDGDASEEHGYMRFMTERDDFEPSRYISQ